MKHLIVVLSFLALSNPNTCNNKKSSMTDKEEKGVQTSAKSKFYINTLSGKDVSEEKLYIIFDEQQNSASGYSGCNTFSCKYTIENESISFGFPIATKMYCEKKATLEQDFFKALMETKIMTINENSLVLKNKSNEILFSGTKSQD